MRSSVVIYIFDVLYSDLESGYGRIIGPPSEVKFEISLLLVVKLERLNQILFAQTVFGNE